jgi:hypothetical protein
VSEVRGVEHAPAIHHQRIAPHAAEQLRHGRELVPARHQHHDFGARQRTLEGLAERHALEFLVADRLCDWVEGGDARAGLAQLPYERECGRLADVVGIGLEG